MIFLSYRLKGVYNIYLISHSQYRYTNKNCYEEKALAVGMQYIRDNKNHFLYLEPEKEPDFDLVLKSLVLIPGGDGEPE